jgi:hypothetical protein
MSTDSHPAIRHGVNPGKFLGSGQIGRCLSRGRFVVVTTDYMHASHDRRPRPDHCGGTWIDWAPAATTSPMPTWPPTRWRTTLNGSALIEDSPVFTVCAGSPAREVSEPTLRVGGPSNPRRRSHLVATSGRCWPRPASCSAAPRWREHRPAVPFSRGLRAPVARGPAAPTVHAIGLYHNVFQPSKRVPNLGGARRDALVVPRLAADALRFRVPESLHLPVGSDVERGRANYHVHHIFQTAPGGVFWIPTTGDGEHGIRH